MSEDMSEEKNHARTRRPAPDEPEKTPSSLPGPNRFPDANRFGEALAPGTIPDEEREERERREGDKKKTAGVDRP